MKKLWIKFMCLFKTPEEQIEYQLKKQFKAKKMPKKVMCEYCGKTLIKGTKRKAGDRIGRWVYADGTTTYHCIPCDDFITQERLNAKKDICICYKHGYEPNIERCIICPDRENCVNTIKIAGEKAIKELSYKKYSI